MGALVVRLVESWAYNPEDTGLNPRARGKNHHKYSSPPTCKMGTWSCTGEQSTLAVSHWSLKTSVGLRVPTPAVRGTVGAPASSLPGSRRLRSTGTQYLLGAQVPWLRQVRVTLVVARHFAFFFHWRSIVLIDITTQASACYCER